MSSESSYVIRFLRCHWFIWFIFVLILLDLYQLGIIKFLNRTISVKVYDINQITNVIKIIFKIIILRNRRDRKMKEKFKLAKKIYLFIYLFISYKIKCFIKFLFWCIFFKYVVNENQRNKTVNHHLAWFGYHILKQASYFIWTKENF